MLSSVYAVSGQSSTHTVISALESLAYNDILAATFSPRVGTLP